MLLTRKSALMALLGATVFGFFGYTEVWNRNTIETSEAQQAADLAAFRAALKPVEIPDSLIELPELRGQGYLRDLRQAAVLDKRLRGLLQSYVAEVDPKRRAEMTLPVLDAWIATSKRDGSLEALFERTGASSPIALSTDDDEDKRVAALLHKVHTLEVVTGKSFFALKDFSEDVGAGEATVSLMSGAVPKDLDARLVDGTYAIPAAALNLRPMQTKHVEAAYSALAASLDRSLLYGRYQYCLQHPVPGFEEMNVEKLCRMELALGKVSSPWREPEKKDQRG
ncbi:hypothetical protein [Pseudomonas sp. GOM6]|uniref:hypothetical protein n=1 Tax=Pseudomonas sp. GOM6 TaxID=3036944 RepID=UPI002409D122|nr:hypothetical protein [Pseudomonas sp. GOM6]MDG1581014.1 hypothetical protein [Pseudomonas sp. GOM6]